MCIKILSSLLVLLAVKDARSGKSFQDFVLPSLQDELTSKVRNHIAGEQAPNTSTSYSNDTFNIDIKPHPILDSHTNTTTYSFDATYKFTLTLSKTDTQSSMPKIAEFKGKIKIEAKPPQSQLEYRMTNSSPDQRFVPVKEEHLGVLDALKWGHEDVILKWHHKSKKRSIESKT